MISESQILYAIFSISSKVNSSWNLALYHLIIDKKIADNPVYYGFIGPNKYITTNQANFL